MTKNIDHELRCSVAIATRLIGDTWSMMILRDFMIFGGTRRFEQLREGLNISRNVLTERLNTMLEGEIIRKSPVTEGAKRMEYKLSRKGWELMPILTGIHQWCETWRQDPTNSMLEFVDSQTKQPIKALSLYSQDGRELGPPDVSVLPKSDAAIAYLEKFNTPPKK